MIVDLAAIKEQVDMMERMTHGDRYSEPEHVYLAYADEDVETLRGNTVALIEAVELLQQRAENAETRLAQLTKVLDVGRRVLGCRRNDPEMHNRLTAFSTAIRVYEGVPQIAIVCGRRIGSRGDE